MPISCHQKWIITWNGGKTICIVMMHLLNTWVVTQTQKTCFPSFLVWCTSFRMFRCGPYMLRAIWTRIHTLVHKLHELSFDLRTVPPKTIFKYFLAVSIQVKVAIDVRISAVVKARWSSILKSLEFRPTVFRGIIFLGVATTFHARTFVILILRDGQTSIVALRYCSGTILLLLFQSKKRNQHVP